MNRIALSLVLALVSALPARAAAQSLPLDRDDEADAPRRSSLWLALAASACAEEARGREGERRVVAELGFAVDRAGPPHALRLSRITAAPRPALPARAVVSPRVVRQAVAAALRFAHVASDGALDGAASRARVTGIVPELRLRAARLWDESLRADLLPADAVRSSAATGANLWLEARAVFRLDRLVFADEEVPLMRLRADAHERAERIALRVATTLAAWQRAWLEVQAEGDGAGAATDAMARLMESEIVLDALTGGWFAAYRDELRARLP